MENNFDNRQRKGKRQKIIIAVILALIVVISFLGGYFVHYAVNGKNINTAVRILKIIEKVGFVYDERTGERREITEEEIADALVNAVLDDYASYYTKSEYQSVAEHGKGNYQGFGLTFFDANLTVDRVTGNSPAFKAGIEIGDKIVYGKYGEKEKSFSKYSEMDNFLYNAPSDIDILLKVQRANKELNFTVQKNAYTASYVTYFDSEEAYCFETDKNGKMVGKSYNGKGKSELFDDVALISFSAFEGGASNQMSLALERMKERGRTKLILDLRGNGGGYMDVLTEVAGYLIYCNGKNNFTVAVSESKNNKEYFYSGKNKFNKDITSISVLADKYSASASECLIGAMLHYGGVFSADKLIIQKDDDGKATTFGKGIMQTTYGFIDGSALKLTTARVLWPDETTCIHKKGITTKAENQVGASQVISRALDVLSEI